MPKLVALCPLALLAVATAAVNATASQPAPATQTSAAVRVAGLDFQIVATALWPKPAVGAPTRVPLALKVTNRTDEPVRLTLFYTLAVTLKDATGKELPIRRLQRGVVADFKPRLIKSGESALLDQTAALFLDPAKDGRMELDGRDGAGGFWFFEGLKPGRYSVGITYENRAAGPPEAPWWIGKAVPKELPVVIEAAPVAPRVGPKPGAAENRLQPMTLLTGKAKNWRWQAVSGGDVEVYDQTPRMVGMAKTKSNGSFELLVEPRDSVDVTVDYAGGRWYKLHIPARGPKLDLGTIQLSPPAPRPGRPVLLPPSPHP